MMKQSICDGTKRRIDGKLEGIVDEIYDSLVLLEAEDSVTDAAKVIAALLNQVARDTMIRVSGNVMANELENEDQ